MGDCALEAGCPPNEVCRGPEFRRFGYAMIDKSDTIILGLRTAVAMSPWFQLVDCTIKRNRAPHVSTPQSSPGEIGPRSSREKSAGVRLR